MPLTTQQDALVKAEIDADPILAALPMDGEGLQTCADALNAIAAPDFMVWRTSVPSQEIFDAIQWDRYTPQDAADGTTLYLNRSLLLRLKQENLQTLLFRDSLNMARPGIRAMLRDACIQLPSGAGGTNTTSAGANASTVLAVCLRKARRVEKVLAVASQASDQTGGTTGRVMGFEGTLTSNDIDRIRRS